MDDDENFNIHVLTNFQILIPLYSDSDAFTITQRTSPSFGLILSPTNTNENYFYQIELLQLNGETEQIVPESLEWAKRGPHQFQKNQNTSIIEAIVCKLRVLAGLFDFRRNNNRSIRFVVRCFSNDVLLSTAFSPICKILAKKRIAENDDISNVIIPIRWMLGAADHTNHSDSQSQQLSEQSYSPEEEYHDEDSIMINMNDSEEHLRSFSNEGDSDELSLLPTSEMNYKAAQFEEGVTNEHSDQYIVLYNGNAEVVGNFRALNFYKASDINIKEDVRLLSSDDRDPRAVILKIDGVEYKFKDSVRHTTNKRFVGYIAQQIESVVPEAVQLIDGILHVDYESLIPYLSESIKQNFKDITEMKADASQIRQVVDMIYKQFIKKEQKRSEKKGTNDKQPNNNRSLRWIIGASLTVLLLIAISVGIFIVTPLVRTNQDNNSPSHDTPTNAPSPTQAPISPDPTLPPKPHFPSIDQDVLVELYYSATGENWEKSNASPSLSVCEWTGVTCNKEFRVIAIEMPDSNLEGTLPDSIGRLSELAGLRLPLNPLYGTIPASIGNLTKLQEILLFGTGFIGSVPLEIFSLPSLKYLNLDSNVRLSWTIPPQIRYMKRLKALSAHSSGLHGTLPNEISQLANLTKLSISNNNLTGTVPSLANTSIQSLYLQSNQFTGPVPKMNENLNIEEIHLANNQFSGEFYLPERILNMLSVLSITDNWFTSVAPELNRNISAPFLCNADNNPFKCPIPDWLKNLCFANCT